MLTSPLRQLEKVVYNPLKALFHARLTFNPVLYATHHRRTLTMSSSQQPGKLSHDDLRADKVFDVRGYKAVVTGGGSGIGLMITQTLVANGADVFISGRKGEKLETVVEKHSPPGDQKYGKIIP